MVQGGRGGGVVRPGGGPFSTGCAAAQSFSLTGNSQTGTYSGRRWREPKARGDRRPIRVRGQLPMASASPHTTPTGHDMTPRDAKRLRVAFDGTPERRRRVPVPTSTARRPLRRQNAVVVEEPDDHAAAVTAALEAAAEAT